MTDWVVNYRDYRPITEIAITTATAVNLRFLRHLKSTPLSFRENKMGNMMLVIFHSSP